jgi:predicted ATPase
MPQRKSIATPESFQTFGELLVYLRKRARLTQEELGRAVGYSRPQITLLEKNQRLPSAATVSALFVPALDLDDAPELAQRLIALAALARKPRTNLPASLSSFIGREKEITEIQRLIIRQRVVTLTGSGGAGKTRLAIESASGLINHFADGVWLIEFAPLNDAALVPNAVTSTLGLLETHGRPLVTTLIDVLREQHRLLIFDNCEHLIDACAQLAATLLQACPQLHILSTSRERLDISGEMPFRVPSLSTPDMLHLPIIQELAHYEAVQLFVERGAAAVSAYTLTAENVAAIARICQRLDGLPLAIELAAARLKTLRAEEIAARLDDRFRLLTSDSRTVLPRQQTLGATIEWSYNLLDDAEQVLLQRLSVFAGSWTLEAAENVCGEGRDVLDLLTHLADKSLINVERVQGQETRYRMLETIRQYAREKLLETGGSEVIRNRHLAYFVKLVEQAEPQLYQPDQVRWLNRLDDELDNLRVALEWALATDVESGLRIAGIPWRWWIARGYFREIGEWLSQLLKRYRTTSTLLARVLASYSLCLFRQGNYAEAIQVAGQSVELARALFDKQTEALSLSYLGHFSMPQRGARESTPFLEQSLALYRALRDKIGQANVLIMLSIDSNSNRERAIPFAKESLALYRELGDLSGIASSLIWLAQCTIVSGDFLSPVPWLEEALSICRQLRDQANEEDALLSLGTLSYWQGDYGRAYAWYEEELKLSERIGDPHLNLWGRVFMAYTLLRQGDLRQARESFEVCIQRAYKADLAIALVFAVEGLASLNVDQEQPERAARLFAWADSRHEKFGAYRPPVEQASVDRDLAIIHARLDEVAFEQAYQTGRAMTLDEAIAFALGD